MEKLVKALIYIWGTAAFIFECFVFFGKWGNFGAVFAIFGSPIAIFIAPGYFGLVYGKWAPAIYLYGSLVILFILIAVTHKKPEPKRT